MQRLNVRQANDDDVPFHGPWVVHCELCNLRYSAEQHGDALAVAREHPRAATHQRWTGVLAMGGELPELRGESHYGHFLYPAGHRRRRIRDAIESGLLYTKDGRRRSFSELDELGWRSSAEEAHRRERSRFENAPRFRPLNVRTVSLGRRSIGRHRGNAYRLYASGVRLGEFVQLDYTGTIYMNGQFLEPAEFEHEASRAYLRAVA